MPVLLYKRKLKQGLTASSLLLIISLSLSGLMTDPSNLEYTTTAKPPERSNVVSAYLATKYFAIAAA